MARGRSQFIGSAGEYYVAYNLAVRSIHAAITLGNAPDVDIIVSSGDGSKHLAIQVKTSRNAYRRKRYGREMREWDVNASIVGRGSPNLWYAFVDLQHDDAGNGSPKVFIVPSLWVASFVQPEWIRKMYMHVSHLWPETEERWDRFESFLEGDPQTLAWCSTTPEVPW